MPLFANTRAPTEAQTLWRALADRFCCLQVGAASCEDKNRLLQRCEPMWRLPESIVRLSRLQFPSEENDVARAYPRARLHARHQPKGAEGHQPDNPAIGSLSSQRQGPEGTGQDVQPVHSRRDQLLRQLPSDAAASDPKDVSMSSARRAINSNGCVTNPKGRKIGLRSCFVQIKRSLLAGSYVMETAEHREPCEREVPVTAMNRTWLTGIGPRSRSWR
jgi:hypothetical protein